MKYEMRAVLRPNRGSLIFMCATLLVNMATGLLVWEDGQVGVVVVVLVLAVALVLVVVVVVVIVLVVL